MSDPQKPVKCEADTNDGLQCSYAWFIPNTEEKIENQELLPKDIKEQGVYRCIATCAIGEINDCKVLANEFELVSANKSSMMPISECPNCHLYLQKSLRSLSQLRL